MKIGLFDSGIGGVTVLKEILKLLPNEEYIYYSDSKNNPFGDKSKEEIVEISDNITDFLINKGCQIIVIACNTASANAANYLREKYSNMPILAIEPAYKMVSDYVKDGNALVLATQATLDSEKFHELYEKYNNNQTALIKCVGLANLIENDKEKEIDEYLDKFIKPFAGDTKCVVLGCTHYPLIVDKIKSVLGQDVIVFDGAVGLARHLYDVVEESNFSHSDTQSITFIDSSNSKEKEDRFYKYLNS